VLAGRLTYRRRAAPRRQRRHVNLECSDQLEVRRFRKSIDFGRRAGEAIMAVRPERGQNGGGNSTFAAKKEVQQLSLRIPKR
jgi:hypothetical protein